MDDIKDENCEEKMKKSAKNIHKQNSNYIYIMCILKLWEKKEWKIWWYKTVITKVYWSRKKYGVKGGKLG
jgi:hypothetical protein